MAVAIRSHSKAEFAEADQAIPRLDTWIYMVSLNEVATDHKDFAPAHAGFLQVIDGLIKIASNMSP